MQVEGDLNHDLDGYRVTVIHGGLELVLTDSLYGFLIQAHAKMPCHVYVLRIALGIHDELDGASALELRLAGFFSELRLDGVKDGRGADAAADAHDAAAISPAAAGSYACALSGAKSAAKAVAH